LLERFFGDLTEFISEKGFASTRELADAILAFLTARNDSPRRYVCKAKSEDTLPKINAPRQAFAAPPTTEHRYFGDGRLATSIEEEIMPSIDNLVH
jgi:hypothetical protein